jgi:hypothetical protein
MIGNCSLDNGSVSRRLQKGRLARLALASPVILGVGLALAPQDQAVSYEEWHRATETQHQRVMAFRDVVRETRPHLRQWLQGEKMAEARRTAYLWIDGFRTGRLTDLTPAIYEDGVEEGPKAEIFRVNAELAASLARNAEREAKKGNVEIAADDAVLAYELLQPLKYSDFSAISMTSLRQRRALNILNRLQGTLSLEKREEVVARLEKASQHRPIQKVAALAKHQYNQMVGQDEADPMSSADWKLMQKLEKVSVERPGSRSVIQSIRQEALTNAAIQTDLAADTAMAYSADLDSLEQVRETIFKLKGQPD